MHVPSNTTTAKAQVCKVALLHRQTVGKKTTPPISANADTIFCFCAEQHTKLEKESQAGQIAPSLFSGDGRKDVRNSLKLHQESFRFNIRKNFFTERVVKHQSRLPKEVVESPRSWRYLRDMEVALRGMA